MVHLKLVVNNQTHGRPSREEAYKKAIAACADYHIEHPIIERGSADEREWKRLWNAAKALYRPNYLTTR